MAMLILLVLPPFFGALLSSEVLLRFFLVFLFTSRNVNSPYILLCLKL